jgi:hypothetical protein
VLVWRVYARLKTQMQRQRSILTRHYTGIFVFLAMILVPASEVLGKPMSLAALAVGTAAGIAYGIWGLKLTRFEETDEGYFFTPNARLGIVIAMLFAARVLYIGFELYAGSTPTPPVYRQPADHAGGWFDGCVFRHVFDRHPALAAEAAEGEPGGVACPAPARGALITPGAAGRDCLSGARASPAPKRRRVQRPRFQSSHRCGREDRSKNFPHV